MSRVGQNPADGGGRVPNPPKPDRTGLSPAADLSHQPANDLVPGRAPANDCAPPTKSNDPTLRPPDLMVLVAEIAALRGCVADLRSDVARLIPKKALVSVAEAARQLGVSVPTIRRKVRCGEIRSRRVGRRVLVDLNRMTSEEAAERAREALGLRGKP